MVLVIYKIQVRGDTVDSAVKRNRYEIDMRNGTVLDKLISFSIPLMLSEFTTLFNAVDIIVVGRFTGSQALAAVGSTTALINVFTNLFIGVSLGANVLAARFYASGQEKKMSETVHTAITFALTSGIVMVFVGLFFSRTALELMDTPADVIEQSALYMRDLFLPDAVFYALQLWCSHSEGRRRYEASTVLPGCCRSDQCRSESAAGNCF